jgi:predicted AAA+ superfamily ATPase
VVGPRLVGKTTYLKLLVKELLEKGVPPRNILYFACDLLRQDKDIVELIRRFDSLAGLGQKFIFLDEVTAVDGWERAVKFLLDSGMLKDKYLYVTGSSTIGLKKERFPGRPIQIRKFMPLSFRSFCKLFGSEELKAALITGFELKPRSVFEFAKTLLPFQDELNRLFNSYLMCGGYPKAFFELMEEGEIRGETYRALYDATVFDMAKLGRSEKITISILLGLLRRYGSKFSLNSLAKEMEIGSHLTVRDYLELMEELCIIRNYHQLDLAKKVPLYRKERKVYFTDPFIYQTFSRVLNFRPDLAQLVEGVVGEHLSRCLEVYFHAGKREVDFICGEVAVEVKWQEKTSPSDFPRIHFPNRILLSKSGLEYLEERNLAMIPVPIFLVGLEQVSFN